MRQTMMDQRECITPQCKGCDRITTMIWKHTNAPVRVCKVYIKPSEWWRRGGCPFNIEIAVKTKGKVRAGQQKTKQQKRGW